jgi:hypothetical protein
VHQAVEYRPNCSLRRDRRLPQPRGRRTRGDLGGP